MAVSRFNLKGQVFTPDFAASIVLFSVFLLMFGVIWNTSIDMFVEDSSVDSDQHHYSFSLLKTPGQPSDWNSSNVEVPGLYSDGYLSAEKFLEFYDVNVEDQRRLLRAGDFYMRVQYLNGSTVSYNGQELEAFSDSGFGPSRNFPENSTVYATRELSILRENGKRVELRYYTWSE